MNNQASHFLVTPTFWCALNLLTFIFMLLIAMGLFLMFEATNLRDFEIEYGDYCSKHTDKYGTCLLTI